MIETERRAAFLKFMSILLAASFLLVSAPRSGTANTPLPASDSWRPPQQPADFNATHEIENLLFNIDESLMAKHIKKLQDFQTRYSYRGDRCYDAAAYIKSVFDRNGLDSYYDDFVFAGYKMRNVIGIKSGLGGTTGTVIICAHYDSISSGPWTFAPGADDNGSGTAAVMAAAETLSDYDFNLTIKFITFSGEEQGMKGSFNYLSGVVANGENITSVINMDMIANNPDPGSNLVKVLLGSDPIVYPVDTIKALNETVLEYGDIIGLNMTMAGRSGSSDHQPFASRFESVFLHEYNFSPYYHSNSDTIDKLNLTYCSNVTQLAVAVVSKLAGICTSDSHPPSHTPGSPSEGSYTIARPTISIDISDPSGIDTDSLRLTVDGNVVAYTASGTQRALNISYIPVAPFADVQHINVTMFAADTAGNNFTHNWSFIVDAISPTPPSNFTIESARIELIKRGLNLNIDTPADSKQAAAPTVIFRDGEYKMWYMAMASNVSKYQINYANSSDGLSWNKYGVVLQYSSIVGQPDYLHVGHPDVLFDDEYKMWYLGHDGSVWRMMYANSSDGINWVKHGVVVDIGPQGSPDGVSVQSPSVIKTDEYRMWYTGFDGLKYCILYANSSDGINWHKSYNTTISPMGPGRRWGDAAIAWPSVVFDGEKYHMWYNRLSTTYYQTHCAISSDGYEWDDLGLAIEAGISTGSYDKIMATYCCAMVQESETKLWYSGFDGTNWRIMFANITPDDPAKDLLLDWTPSASDDIAFYEIFRECRPSAFRYPLERALPEVYIPPIGLTPWTFEKAGEANITVYGPVTGSDPPHFYLPDDNIINMDLYLSQVAGGWHRLAKDTDFTIDTISGYVTLSTPLFETGGTLYAWYNHSVGRALRTNGHGVADVRAADSSIDYYYVVRAVDKAGNYAYCTDMPGKIGTQVTAGSWNLICNPFLESSTPISDALSGPEWILARTWEPARLPYHWTSNRPGSTNTLLSIDGSAGVWVRAATGGSYAVSGRIANKSINLVAGWNLVSYPYYEILSVNEALSGIPWDQVEVMDSTSPTLLKQLDGNDMLVPGQGLWVRVTSDAVWNAINIP